MVTTKICRVSPEHHRRLRIMAGYQRAEIRAILERLIDAAFQASKLSEAETMQPVYPVIAPDAHLDDMGE